MSWLWHCNCQMTVDCDAALMLQSVVACKNVMYVSITCLWSIDCDFETCLWSIDCNFKTCLWSIDCDFS